MNEPFYIDEVIVFFMLFADCINEVLGNKEKNGGFECYEQGEGLG